MAAPYPTAVSTNLVEIKTLASFGGGFFMGVILASSMKLGHIVKNI